MQLEKIITLANRKVLHRFQAMERSLRATGCQLPLWVIPYDDDLFELPANATWWVKPEILDWLKAEQTHPMYRKYPCLTEANYQFVDSDVIFLRNPEKVLADQAGFIASCGHWRDPDHTMTVESETILRGLSDEWRYRIFNAGQFACDRALYLVEELKQRCQDPRYIGSCLRFPYHDQPGLNLLVNLSGVPIHNLMLPPVGMESTWAGDYPDSTYAANWMPETKMPYLIHWAGCHSAMDLPIDQRMLDFLTVEERADFLRQCTETVQRQAKERHSLRGRLRRLRQTLRARLSRQRK